MPPPLCRLAALFVLFERVSFAVVPSASSGASEKTGEPGDAKLARRRRYRRKRRSGESRGLLRVPPCPLRACARRPVRCMRLRGASAFNKSAPIFVGARGCDEFVVAPVVPGERTKSSGARVGP